MAGLARKISASSNYILFILIILGFLVLINFLSTRYFQRRDLTQNQLYTLSESSRKTASELDDIVNIKCYFSKKLPSYAVNIKRQVTDLLEEYRAYSKNNIRISRLLP